MKVTVFTAADYADSVGGRLTLVGVFDNFQLEECPRAFKPFAVAAKIVAEPRDSGHERDGRLVLRKVGNTKKEVFGIPFKIRFDMKSPEKVNSILLAFNVLGVTFDSFGRYRLDLLVASRVVASTRLNVVQTEAPQ